MARSTQTRPRNTESAVDTIGSALNPLTMPLRYKVGLVGLAIAAVLPFSISILDVASLTGVFYLMMFAMSWDLVSGYTGELSFGHAFFFALGGYGTAVLNIQHGLGPLTSIAGASLIAAVGGLVIGIPALRITGPYLSLVTLIVPFILARVFIIFNDGLPFIAPAGLYGTSGFPSSPAPLVGMGPNALIVVESFEMVIVGDYYIAFLAFLAVLVLLLAVTRSNAGDVFTAIREDERAVESAGINPAKFKLFAFVLSALVGGIAGALYVHSGAGHPQPAQLLVLMVSLQVVIMTVLGGMGTIVGAAVGATFFAAARGIFTIASNNGLVIPGIEKTLLQLTPIPLFLLAVVVLFNMPEGIVPVTIRLGRRFGYWLGTTSAGPYLSRVGLIPEGEPPKERSEGSSPIQSTIAKYREDIQNLSNSLRNR